MKKFAALLALIMLTAFSFLPVHEAESGKGGCTHWYDHSTVLVIRYEDGTAIYHTTMTRKCKGQEEHLDYCWWYNELTDEYREVACP